MKIKITKDKQGFETIYEKHECSAISSVTIKHVEKQKPMTIEELAAAFHAGKFANVKDKPTAIECKFRDGVVSSFTHPKNNTAYVRQYGISVTKDGKELFLQTWDDGLYCYETIKGKLLWRSKTNCIGEIAVFDSVIACAQMDKGIEIISIKGGSKIKSIPSNMSNLELKKLDDKNFIYKKNIGIYHKVSINNFFEERVE